MHMLPLVRQTDGDASYEGQFAFRQGRHRSGMTVNQSCSTNGQITDVREAASARACQLYCLWRTGLSSEVWREAVLASFVLQMNDLDHRISTASAHTSSRCFCREVARRIRAFPCLCLVCARHSQHQNAHSYHVCVKIGRLSISCDDREHVACVHKASISEINRSRGCCRSLSHSLPHR